MLGVNSTPEHIRQLRWDRWPHILETQQFSHEVLDPLMVYMCGVEQKIVENGGSFNDCRLSQPLPPARRITFYRDEGTTRTEITFKEASRILGFDWYAIEGSLSSRLKGESMTLRTMALTQVAGMGPIRLTDYFIVRSEEAGAAKTAMEAVEAANSDGFIRLPLPVANAGDGENQHPKQALTDFLTIYRERSCTGMRHSLDDITLLLVGDIRHSRTINSLCHLLGKFSSHHRIKIIFCSHSSIGPKEGILKYLEKHDITYKVVTDLTAHIPEADVVYMTRIQRERRSPKDALLTPKDREAYVLRRRHLDRLKPDAFVMHPLPINEDPMDPPAEIDPEIRNLVLENHRQCAWGRQSLRGLVVSYVLLDLIEAGLQQHPQYPAVA